VGVLGWVPPQVTPNPRALHLLQEEMQVWERQGPLRLEFAQ
jgi:hypothetical protein